MLETQGLLLDGGKWEETGSFCGQTVTLIGSSSLLCPGSPFSTQDQGGNLVGAIFWALSLRRLMNNKIF